MFLFDDKLLHLRGHYCQDISHAHENFYSFFFFNGKTCFVRKLPVILTVRLGIEVWCWCVSHLGFKGTEEVGEGKAEDVQVWSSIHIGKQKSLSHCFLSLNAACFTYKRMNNRYWGFQSVDWGITVFMIIFQFLYE